MNTLSHVQHANIHYQIVPADPFAHIYQISLQIASPAREGQRLNLPAWIPGSYMIRDFARNIISLRARQGNQWVSVRKLDKSTWELGEVNGPVIVEYEVYAWDLSVRAAHLDQNHAYFNGSSVFLAVVGQEHVRCTLDIQAPKGIDSTHWRIATSLPEFTATRYGFGVYQAENYDALIDHPVEIADFTLASFDACGVPHDFVITGKHSADMPRLSEDLKKICEYQIRMFGEPAPFDRYVFILWAVGEGYGGLEHRASTSLISARDELPSIHERNTISEGYRNFLGLCSHEYFHSWNVKRIKPAVFFPYQLHQEGHTELLWAFEGITSYYDDLTLVRSGLISPQSYLELLGRSLTRLSRTPGRLRQTLVESSFDAWTKFYKQDENSPNAIVSYYLKGSLVALGLDLLLRELSQHEISLDTVMLQLWEEFGKTQRGLQEADVERATLAIVKAKLGDLAEARVMRFFQQALRDTQDFDLDGLLQRVGVSVVRRAADSPNDKGGVPGSANGIERVTLGANFAADSAGAKIQTLLNGSAGHQAGLSAGDVVVAINGIKTDVGRIESQLARFAAGERVSVHAFRRDELFCVELELQRAPKDTCYLQVEDEAKLRRWLFG
ncbi:Peptidase M61 [gamma proteobacterium HdN1]|nr:Peptidase M61 [gamma proteobacterium HdN1]